MEIENVVLANWEYFTSGEKMDKLKTGKWMIFFKFFDERETIRSYCERSVVERIVRTAKLSSMPRKDGNGVACFFLEIDDYNQHKKIINFLIENNLIPKKKNGDYYNLSFKLDEQTRNNEYNENFKSVLKLEELLDLRTGEWK
ncbi:hypothetical protein [Enterococcus sp. N342-3-1-2]